MLIIRETDRVRLLAKRRFHARCAEKREMSFTRAGLPLVGPPASAIRLQVRCIEMGAKRERETGTGLLHVDAHPTPIGVHLHANFRTAKHQHDALLVSQSRPANASPEGSANAQSSVAPREIAWSAKVGGTTSKFARRNAECGTKARARRFKGILFTVKCQNASASSSSGDEPSFAEDYPQRTGICLRRSSGCTPKD